MSVYTVAHATKQLPNDSSSSSSSSSSNNNNNNNNNNNSSNSNNVTHDNKSKPTSQYVINRATGGSYFSRNLNTSTDLSVQATRPTSKTALLIRQRRAVLEQLSCYLCKGYLIDAVTIGECMDSFCKSCILRYMQTNNDCPKCDTLIHKTNPSSTIRSDKVLQDIVYKLVPGLYDDEMKRRREFYSDSFESSEDCDDEDGSGSSQPSSNRMNTSEHYGLVSHPKPFYKPTDKIDLSIEPLIRGNKHIVYFDTERHSIFTNFDGNQKKSCNNPSYTTLDSHQFKSYLRCPAIITVSQLRRLISIKFNISTNDSVSLIYLNEQLKDDYTLIDVAYIYDWKGVEPMKIFFDIERKPIPAIKFNEYFVTNGQSVKRDSEQSQTRQQTVKKVCIDPEPKYFNETINNNTHKSYNRMQPGSSNVKLPVAVNRTYQSLQTSNSFQATTSTTATTTNGLLSATKRTGLALIPVTSIGLQSSSSPSFVNTVTRVTSKRVPNGTETFNQSSMKSFKSSTSNSPQVGTSHHPSPIAKMNINLNTMTTSFAVKQSSNQTGTVCPASSIIHQTSKHQQIVSQKTTVTTASVATASTSANRSSSHESIRTSASSSSMDQGFKSSPKLAISFVTEQGITLMRRINNQMDLNSSNTPSHSLKSSTMNSSIIRNNTPMSTAPGVQKTGTSNNHQPQSLRSSESTSSLDRSSQSATPSASGSSVSNINNLSPRPLLKIKPVYKTFVDPTKIKTPNMRRLSHINRH